MRTLAPLFAVILLAVAIPGHAEETQTTFNYATQLGVAEVDATGAGCLTIANPGLRENQPLTLVILGPPQKVVERKIGKKLSASCSRNSEAPPDSSFYTFASGGENFDPAIAVVGSANAFKLERGQVRSDLNGDGTLESFRSCTSHEGLHLTVWAGAVLETERRWHEYYYLGFDVEPSCEPRDYRE